jgi:PAS domain S-box-containing protein
MVVDWMTPWVLYDVVRTNWGWSYIFGPAYMVQFGIGMIGVGRTCQLVRRSLKREASPADRRQQPWFVIACTLPATVTLLTDVVLPALGYRYPVLGTISFSALGVIAVWSIQRFGYFMLSPGNFADEILDTLSDGVLLVGADDGIRVANPRIQAISGYDTSALLGMRWPTLLQRSENGEELEGGAVEYELITAEGQRTPVAVSMSRFHDRQGSHIGRVLVVRDVHELKDLRRRVMRSARLAAVGELAAGVAHEINNPIAFVRSNLNQLQAHWKTLRTDLAQPIAECSLGEIVGEGDELIEESIEGIDRAAQIVRAIRGFSHAGAEIRELANVNELIENVLHMATSQLHSHVRVERFYGDVPPILCTQQEIKQVFVNLIVNAGHAVSDGGTIRIRTETEPGWVIVHVEDDGDGIPPEILDRIFDPFFTTKGVGEGTGLGLGIAYQITQSHGGEISVDSVLGQGARFRVHLPADAVDLEKIAPE